jgi:hypothetical protein
VINFLSFNERNSSISRVIDSRRKIVLCLINEMCIYGFGMEIGTNNLKDPDVDWKWSMNWVHVARLRLGL